MIGLGHRAALERRATRVRILRNLLEDLPFAEGQAATLEVGCGHGHFLATYATAYPRHFCVGIDLISRRVALAQRKLDRSSLTNARVFKAALQECLEALPPHCVFHHVFFLFPDPWPKRRHRKHRLIQPKTLTALRPFMDPKARLYFRTDEQAFFRWSQTCVKCHPQWRQDTKTPWPFEAPSFFQELMDNWHSAIFKPA